MILDIVVLHCLLIVELVTVVAKYLGHTKIEETLNTYTHMFSVALDSVVSIIDNLDNN